MDMLNSQRQTMNSFEAQFVDNRSAELIQRVSAVMPIVDELRSKNMIHKEKYDEIRAEKTPQEQMRKLFDSLNSGGDKVKKEFYSLLEMHEQHLFRDLGGISRKRRRGSDAESPVPSKKRHTESYERDNPKCNIASTSIPTYIVNIVNERKTPCMEKTAIIHPSVSTPAAPKTVIKTPAFKKKKPTAPKKEKKPAEPKKEKKPPAPKKEKKPAEPKKEKKPPAPKKEKKPAEPKKEKKPPAPKKEKKPAEPKEENIPTEIKKENIPTEIKKENIPTEIKKENIPTEIKKENIPTEIKKENIPTEIKKENIPTEIKKENIPTEIKKENIPTEIKKENIPTEIKKENIPTEIKKENIPTEIKKENILPAPKEENKPTEARKEMILKPTEEKKLIVTKKKKPTEPKNVKKPTEAKKVKKPTEAKKVKKPTEAKKVKKPTEAKKVKKPTEAKKVKKPTEAKKAMILKPKKKKKPIVAKKKKPREPKKVKKPTEAKKAMILKPKKKKKPIVAKKKKPREPKKVKKPPEPSGLNLRCQSCVHITDSDRWVQVEPSVCRDEGGSRFRISTQAGRFECSRTRMRWVCAGDITLQYCAVDGRFLSEDLERLQCEQIGPVIDVTVISGTLEEAHLPHYACLAESDPSLKDTVKLLSKRDEGVYLQSVELTRFHAKILQPSFSLTTLIIKWFMKWEEHCNLLVYMRCKDPLILHIYFFPVNDSCLKEKVEQNEKSSHMISHPRPNRPFRMKTPHRLEVPGASVHPVEGISFRTDVEPNFFKVRQRLDGDVEMNLFREEDQMSVWTATIWKEEFVQLNQQQVQDEPRLNREIDRDQFFNKHRLDLIQRVKKINRIADKLREERIIDEEFYSKILHTNLTNEDRMREICLSVHSSGTTAKDKFIVILQEEEPYLFDELIRSDF